MYETTVSRLASQPTARLRIIADVIDGADILSTMISCHDVFEFFSITMVTQPFFELQVVSDFTALDMPVTTGVSLAPRL